ncbi:hypothetical protein SYNPS1DRAFT_28163 [Syncephalis pseudoplumigaleata]|uniref:Uncharacterized protein n=1 Tax=Syncephalis pseudoplumigaleata TaxID=1712513 RepID=A0A4P9Z0Y6_9FUNG|nr:hypothetical protein SYNPS1DRAFT_28163 [Syncephalis pseudoplumigaleata]|eukprot:RKP26133.1 hypothetical protein SYNPS1DRAFT_28163 [Syncephalis pseudoplumigaleata]
MVYPSMDYILRPERPYFYNGIALHWKFGYDRLEDECVFAPVNTTDPRLRAIASHASRHADFAVMFDCPESLSLKCKDQSRIRESMAVFFRQLLLTGFPPVKLFILVGDAGRLAFVGDDYIIYRSPSAFQAYIHSVPVTVTVVQTNDTADPHIDGIRNATHYHYAAMHGKWRRTGRCAPPSLPTEVNETNEARTSYRVWTYKWICFTIISAALLYAWARFIRMAALAPVSIDICMATFLITSIYAILIWFASNARKLSNHPKGYILYVKLSFFSAVGFISNIVFIVCDLLAAVESFRDPDTMIVTMECVHNTIHLIRVLVFLAVPGIRWPAAKNAQASTAREPLGGMTTIGEETTSAEEMPIAKRLTMAFAKRLTGYIRMPT